MSKLDIDKLKAMQPDIDSEAKKEIYDNLPESLIQFLKDEVIYYTLDEVKTRNNSDQSARVINNWIEQGLIKVDDNDKGKINRFSREEAFWLYLVDELRGFGVSLETLRIIRDELFNEIFPSFKIIRIAIIKTIFDNSQMLILFADGTFNLMSSNLYKKWLSKLMLPSHICVDFSKILSKIFVKNSLHEIIRNENIFEKNHCLKLLYFLKTGDFEFIKIEISEGDLRLIENANQFFLNSTLMNLILQGDYFQTEVISNGKHFIIKP